MIIISSLLLASIEPNPDPISEASTNSSNVSSLLGDLNTLKDRFLVVHYNSQSVVNKLDIIESELYNFDIIIYIDICLTETWLDKTTLINNLFLNEYNLYRRDRVGERYGCICVYAKQNTYSHRRQDLEPPNIECVWIEISTHNKKYLIGTFYRLPNSTNEIISSIEDSIALAFDTNIPNILITGDFDLDISKPSASRKVRGFCQHFSLGQLNNEPTHYTELSFSIIKIHKSDPAWLTNNIKRLMRKRKRLYDKYKRSKDNADFENYKNVRNKVMYEIRKSKIYQIQTLTEKLEQKNLNQKLVENFKNFY